MEQIVFLKNVSMYYIARSGMISACHGHAEM